MFHKHGMNGSNCHGKHNDEGLTSELTLLVLCRTVSDVAAGFLGVVIAAVSVASSAMQQILCRFYLRKHDVSANELLATTAPLQVTY